MRALESTRTKMTFHFRRCNGHSQGPQTPEEDCKGPEYTNQTTKLDLMLSQAGGAVSTSRLIKAMLPVYERQHLPG